MKLCLFALTGFGNSVLEKAVESDCIDEVMVFTRRESGKFPYYESEDLLGFCKREDIAVFTEDEISDKMRLTIIKEYSPDLMIVATYHKKIPAELLALPKYKAVNIHPSLLPAYRGATPTNWALINGESRTGITFHLVSEEYDMGAVLYQKEVPISDLDDGKLRKYLAEIAGDELDKFIADYTSIKLDPKQQSRRDGSYYPKVTSEEGIKLLNSGLFEPDNIRKGLTPFPGVESLRKELKWDTKVMS